MKKLIGSTCASLIYAMIGFVILCLLVGAIERVGVLITIIIVAGLALFVFILWAAINWGGFME